MTKRDLPAFSALLARIAQLYRCALPCETIDVYWHALQNQSIAAIRTALQQHVTDEQRGRYFPTPADVLHQLRKDDKQAARLAWQQVIDALHHTGAYGTVQFDDPLIAVVLRKMGGWSRLCRSLEADLPRHQQQFCQQYYLYLKQPPVLTPAITAPFRSLCDRHNGTPSLGQSSTQSQRASQNPNDVGQSKEKSDDR